MKATLERNNWAKKAINPIPKLDTFKFNKRLKFGKRGFVFCQGEK